MDTLCRRECRLISLKVGPNSILNFFKLMLLFRINIIMSQAGNDNLTHQLSSNFTVQTQLQDSTIPVQQSVLCAIC